MLCAGHFAGYLGSVVIWKIPQCPCLSGGGLRSGDLEVIPGSKSQKGLCSFRVLSHLFPHQSPCPQERKGILGVGMDHSRQGQSQEIPFLSGTLYPSLSSPGFLKFLCITERKHFGGSAVDWLLVAVWGFGVQSVAWLGVGSHSRGSRSRRWPHVLSGSICSSLCWVHGAGPRGRFSAGAERLWG